MPREKPDLPATQALLDSALQPSTPDPADILRRIAQGERAPSAAPVPAPATVAPATPSAPIAPSAPEDILRQIAQGARAPAAAPTPTAPAQPTPEDTLRHIAAGGRLPAPVTAPDSGYPTGAGDLHGIAADAARRHGVPVSLFLAQIQQESGFQRNAVSKAGAQGIAQFMPATARGMGLTDPFNAEAALDKAAQLMAQNFKQYGKWDLALAAYNGGPRAVRNGRVWNVPETQNYVASIMGKANHYPAGTAAQYGVTYGPPAAPPRANSRTTGAVPPSSLPPAAPYQPQQPGDLPAEPRHSTVAPGPQKNALARPLVTLPSGKDVSGADIANFAFSSVAPTLSRVLNRGPRPGQSQDQADMEVAAAAISDFSLLRGAGLVAKLAENRFALTNVGKAWLAAQKVAPAAKQTLMRIFNPGGLIGAGAAGGLYGVALEAPQNKPLEQKALGAVQTAGGQVALHLGLGALGELLRGGRPVPTAEIAKAAGIAPEDAAQQMAALEQQGQVERTPTGWRAAQARIVAAREARGPLPQPGETVRVQGSTEPLTVEAATPARVTARARNGQRVTVTPDRLQPVAGPTPHEQALTAQEQLRQQNLAESPPGAVAPRPAPPEEALPGVVRKTPALTPEDHAPLDAAEQAAAERLRQRRAARAILPPETSPDATTTPAARPQPPDARGAVPSAVPRPEPAAGPEGPADAGARDAGAAPLPFRVTAKGGIKPAGRAPLTFDQTSDVAEIHAAIQSGDLAHVIETMGPERSHAALDHLQRLEDLGIQDQAVQAHRDWIDQQYRQMERRDRAPSGVMGQDQAAFDQQLKQKIMTSWALIDRVDRSSGKRLRFYDIATELNPQEKARLKQLVATPGRQEREFFTSSGTHGPEGMIDANHLPYEVGQAWERPHRPKAPKAEYRHLLTLGAEVPEKPTLPQRATTALDTAEAAAQARLKSRSGRLHSGIDPEDLADLAIIGAARIGKGAIRFAEWSAGMVRDYGEEIRPHLEAIWAAAKEHYNATFRRDNPRLPSVEPATAPEPPAGQNVPPEPPARSAGPGEAAGGIPAAEPAAEPHPINYQPRAPGGTPEGGRVTGPPEYPAGHPKAEPGAKVTGLAEQQNAREVAAGQLQRMPEKSAESVTLEQVQQHGEGVLKGIEKSGADPIKHAEDLAAKVAAEKRPATWRETGVFLAGKRRLILERDNLGDRLDLTSRADPKRPDLQLQYDAADQRLQKFANDVQKAGSRAGQSLSAWRAGVDVNYGSPANVIREAERVSAKPVDAKTKQLLTGLAGSVQKLNAQVETLGKARDALRARAASGDRAATMAMPEYADRVNRAQTQANRNMNRIAMELNRLKPETPGAWAQRVLVASGLSNPKLPEIKAISNTVAAALSAPERALRGAVDVPLSKLQGRPREVYAQEAARGAMGYLSSVPAAIRDMLDVLGTGTSGYELNTEYGPQREFGGGGRNPFNWPKRAIDAVRALDLRPAREGEFVAQATREALKDQAAARAAGTAVPDFQTRFTEHLTHPTPEMEAAVKDQVAKMTFHGAEPDTIIKGLEMAANWEPAAKFAEPAPWMRGVRPLRAMALFMRTTYEIAKVGTKYSPAGLADLIVNYKTPEAAATISRAAVGTAIMGLVGSQAAAGRVTGAPPLGGAEKRYWQEHNIQPYSFLWGNRWVSWRHTPIAVPMEMATRIVTEWQRSGQEPLPKKIAEAAFNGFSGWGLGMSHAGVFTAMSGVIDALTEPGRKLERVGEHLAQEVVPFSSFLREIANSTDRYQRKPGSVGDALKGLVPGLSQQVPPRTSGRSGAGVPLQRGSGPAALSPIQVSGPSGKAPYPQAPQPKGRKSANPYGGPSNPWGGSSNPWR